MQISIKNFSELTTSELYAVLQLRAEVFVVEQDCVYQDVDGKDFEAIHIIGVDKNRVVAYTRIFAPGLYFKEASIGRVVVAKDARQYGYGKDIMIASISAVKQHYSEGNIRISAQEYLLKFYSELGFITEGDGYLEDGIPHRNMVYNGNC